MAASAVPIMQTSSGGRWRRSSEHLAPAARALEAQTTLIAAMGDESGAFSVSRIAAKAYFMATAR